MGPNIPYNIHHRSQSFHGSHFITYNNILTNGILDRSPTQRRFFRLCIRESIRSTPLNIHFVNIRKSRIFSYPACRFLLRPKSASLSTDIFCDAPVHSRFVATMNFTFSSRRFSSSIDTCTRLGGGRWV